MMMLKIVSIFFLIAVAFAFVWALTELTIETIKEKDDVDKGNR